MLKLIVQKRDPMRMKLGMLRDSSVGNSTDVVYARRSEMCYA